MPNKREYIFSSRNSLRWYINNLEWINIIGIFIIIIMILVSTYDKKSNHEIILVITLISLFILFITYLIIYYFKKFAYLIIFNLNDNIIYFYMFRNLGKIKLSTYEIKKIVVGYSICFYLNDKIIKYKTHGPKDELIHFLEQNFYVESNIFRYFPYK